MPTVDLYNQEEAKGKLDLNKHLIKQSTATFFLRASGNELNAFNIFDNDILIVDKSCIPNNNNLVVATINEELVIRRFVTKGKEAVLLTPNNNKEKSFNDDEGSSIIWGVVALLNEYYMSKKNNYIKKRMQDLLDDRNWTQKDLARETSLTHIHVNNIYNGKSKKEADIIKIAHIFGVEPDFLLNECTNHFPDSKRRLIETKLFSHITRIIDKLISNENIAMPESTFSTISDVTYKCFKYRADYTDNDIHNFVCGIVFFCLENKIALSKNT